LTDRLTRGEGVDMENRRRGLHAVPVVVSETLFLAVTLIALVVGVVAWLVGASGVASAAWAAGAVVAVVPTAWAIVVTIRARRPGVDVIAVMALVGTLAVGEYAAGAVIAVMVATGRLLESRAASRAERDLRNLLTKAPQVVHRYEGELLTDPPLSEVVPGDRLLVKPGEIVPVDGRIDSEMAVLDESSLTGESVPVTRTTNETVQSGAINAGGPFDLRAVATAEGSTFAGIVRLVEKAQADTAPFVRLADRYALAFVPIALAIAAIAWVASGDVVRAVAVLVVATPCPLILAAPIAIVSGLGRAARRGVIVKGGGVLERLAQAQVLVFDKTGTVTRGHPTVVETVTAEWVDADVLLRAAASIEQISPHVLASAVVRAAAERGLEPIWPDDVDEVVGMGIAGTVDGSTVRVGRLAWLAAEHHPTWVKHVQRRVMLDGSLSVYVELDGRLAGALVLEDPLRPDAPRTLREMRRAGVQRIVMATGDRAAVADAVGAALGVDEVLAERSPADKVTAVMLERKLGVTVMVGDGVNDAPALAAADVGVALGARGSTASSDAADVVLVVDRLDRLAEGLAIARRSRRIALQSVVVGMALSGVAMVAAAFGLLPPIVGAIVQEVIDVFVIVNSLRVLIGSESRLRLEGEEAEISHRLQEEHRDLWQGIPRIRLVADGLGSVSTDEARLELRSLQRFLLDELLPHEQAEEQEFYPVVARLIGGADPTGPMSRAHVEIAHLVGLFGRLLDELAVDGPDVDDERELRRVLYGLDAVLRLHFAQEEEGYLSLADDPTAG
jgi:heavy metal translocating P-type ATPase